jgi:hypothetical protein
MTFKSGEVVITSILQGAERQVGMLVDVAHASRDTISKLPPGSERAGRYVAGL